MNNVKNWFIVKRDFTFPRDEFGQPLEFDKWTSDTKKKAQENAQATTTLQCGLAQEQLSKVGPFDSAKELWDKFVELHEGTCDSQIAKRDLLLSRL